MNTHILTPTPDQVKNVNRAAAKMIAIFVGSLIAQTFIGKKVRSATTTKGSVGWTLASIATALGTYFLSKPYETKIIESIPFEDLDSLLFDFEDSKTPMERLFDGSMNDDTREESTL